MKIDGECVSKSSPPTKTSLLAPSSATPSILIPEVVTRNAEKFKTTPSVATNVKQTTPFGIVAVVTTAQTGTVSEVSTVLTNARPTVNTLLEKELTTTKSGDEIDRAVTDEQLAVGMTEGIHLEEGIITYPLVNDKLEMQEFEN